jgi:hypothetical protein
MHKRRINRLSPLTCFRVAIAALLSACSIAAHAAPDELQVYGDDSNKPGEPSVDLFATFVTHRPKVANSEGLKSAYHVLRVSPEYSLGLTDQLQTAVQLYTSVAPGAKYDVDGLRAEIVFIRRHDDDDHFFWGGLAEIGRLPRYTSLSDLNVELKGIAGIKSDDWTFVVNPVVGWSIKGAGKGESPDIALNAKLTRKLNREWDAGLEHYADLGTAKNFGHFGQQNQQLFAFAVYKQKEWQLNSGIGRGLSTVSDAWALKLVFTREFD